MEKLQNLSAINTNTIEGRLLIAAMVKLTTESQTDKTPDEVLWQCHELAEKMYEDATPIPTTEPEAKQSFEQELSSLINRRSIENNSDTPDYILAKFLNTCLFGYEMAVKTRDKWFNVNMWATNKIK